MERIFIETKLLMCTEAIKGIKDVFDSVLKDLQIMINSCKEIQPTNSSEFNSYKEQMTCVLMLVHETKTSIALIQNMNMLKFNDLLLNQVIFRDTMLKKLPAITMINKINDVCTPTIKTLDIHNSKLTANTNKSRDLSSTVKNSTFRATITHIENIEKLTFIICLLFPGKMTSLSRIEDFPALNCLPGVGEKFAICLENNTILHCICVNNLQPISVDLQDIEETVVFNKAIKCQLISLVECDGTLNKKHSTLISICTQLETKNAMFKMENKVVDTVFVELLKDKEWTRDVENHYKTVKPIKNKNNKIALEIDPIDLTQSPSIMTVCITYLCGIVVFYAQTPIQKGQCSKLCWFDADIEETKKLRTMPVRGDLVLAKFIKDGNWYRARVDDIIFDGAFIKVFFVDFGNETMVSLSSLAELDPEAKSWKFRASRFRLGNVTAYQKYDTNQNNKHLDALQSELFELVVQVEILSMEDNDELVVKFVDPQSTMIIDDFVENKFLQLQI